MPAALENKAHLIAELTRVLNQHGETDTAYLRRTLGLGYEQVRSLIDDATFYEGIRIYERQARKRVLYGLLPPDTHTNLKRNYE